MTRTFHLVLAEQSSKRALGPLLQITTIPSLLDHAAHQSYVIEMAKSILSVYQQRQTLIICSASEHAVCNLRMPWVAQLEQAATRLRGPQRVGGATDNAKDCKDIGTI